MRSYELRLRQNDASAYNSSSLHPHKLNYQTLSIL